MVFLKLLGRILPGALNEMLELTDPNGTSSLSHSVNWRPAPIRLVGESVVIRCPLKQTPTLQVNAFICRGPFSIMLVLFFFKVLFLKTRHEGVKAPKCSPKRRLPSLTSPMAQICTCPVELSRFCSVS